MKEDEPNGEDLIARSECAWVNRDLEKKALSHAIAQVVPGAATITVTKNEILYSLNKPEDFILAIVEFFEDDTHRVHYLRQPFHREPDFGVTSVNYELGELLAQAEPPQ